MNITIMVAPPLVSAVDGKRRLELGVPPSADVGDIVDTLFKLYPKLQSHLGSDQRTDKHGLSLFWTNAQTLFLCATVPSRAVQS